MAGLGGGDCETMCHGQLRGRAPAYCRNPLKWLWPTETLSRDATAGMAEVPLTHASPFDPARLMTGIQDRTRNGKRPGDCHLIVGEGRKMRRFVLLSMVGLMVLALSSMAWAAGGPPNSPPGAAAQERARQFQQTMNEIQENLRDVRQSRIAIREMQGDIRGLAMQIREEIRRIREPGLPLSEEQLEEIRNLTAELRGIGRSMADTVGQINEQAGLMREARAELAAIPLINALSRIQAVQEARLSHLEDLVAAMNALLARLQAIQGDGG